MYYVEMPNSLIVTQRKGPTKAIYDLKNDLVDGLSSKVQCYQSFVNASKVTLSFANLLFLSHLLARKIVGKKPLIDYNQLHVITSNEYSNILWKKVMEKEGIKKIKKQKRKEREEKKS
jgi:hypothetical protein